MNRPIFISYASPEDSAYAESLANRIEAELGLPAWYFERDEPAGVYYDPEIVKQIANSQAVVVLLSPASADSNFILMEVAYAQEKGKPIIPIVMSPVRQGSRRAGMTDGRVMFRLRIANLIDARGGVDPLPQLQDAIAKSAQALPGLRNTIRLDEALEALPTLAPTDITDLTGQTIRGYRVLSLVARTQSSVVYQAEEIAVKRQVALKAILPEYAAAPAFQKHFQAEAERIARLSDTSHIVALFSFWTDDSGAYLVMPWMPGGTLSKLIGGSPNPPGLVARIVSQVGQALIAAHRQGILHLDIKPGNILRNGAGQSFLSDFGISRDVRERGAQRAVMYTPGYAPPEQHVAGGELSAKADIYSLAVVVAELLLGARLFVGAAGYQQQQRGLAEAIFAQLPAPVAPVLQQALAPNLALRQADMLSFVTELQAALQVARSTTAGDEDDDSLQSVIDAPNPYLGIAPFQEQDSERFFGRTAAIKALLALLAQPSADARFLAIAGASGSGKSSLVRAGLIPELRAGQFPGAEHWRIRLFTPGPDPLAALAAALNTESSLSVTVLRDELDADELGLLRVAAASLPTDPRVELLLVIDQFEELFTLATDPDLRRRLLTSIIAAVREPASRLRVIITLRGDFYDRPIQEPAFGKLLLSRTFWVEPLSEQELVDAIVQPAQAVKVAVERSLVRELLAEMASQPGMLPLLQYTLAYLFERREGGALNLQAYRAGDGVRGILSQRAAELYEALSPTQQRLAQQLFLRLVTPGEGVADTRRRVRRSELADLSSGASPMSATGTTQPGGAASSSQATGAGGSSSSISAFAQRSSADPADLDRILERFGAAEARLLTFDREPGTQAPTVEVAHEALLDRQQGWRLLGQWLDTARGDLRTQRRLAEAATEWQRQGRDDTFLAAGGVLITFEELAQRDLVDLTALERGYLEVSAAAREHARITEEERRDRELRQAQQIAEQAQQLAKEQEERAEKERALAEAEADRARLATEQTEQAVKLATEQTERARLATLREQEQIITNRKLQRRNFGISVALVTALIASVASVILFSSADQNAKAAEQRRLEALAQLQIADSRRLAAEAGNLATLGKIELSLLLALESVGLSTNPATLQALQVAIAARPFNITSLLGHGAKVNSAVFHPNGDLILTASDDNAIHLWDASGSRLVELRKHRAKVNTAIFSNDGSLILTASDDATAQVWRTSEVISNNLDEEPIVLSDHTDAISKVLFDPSEKYILTASVDSTARLWSIEGEVLAILRDHTAPINDVAISPNGSLIVTASQDGTAKLWNTDGQLLKTLSDHTESVVSVAFNPSGTRIATASVDNSARLWDTKGNLLAIMDGHSAVVNRVVFSPDGKNILTASSDTTARLWDSRGEFVASFDGHTDAVWFAVFSPDSTHILTTSRDRTARLWSRDGKVLFHLSGHLDQVGPPTFSPDGKRILTVSTDRTVRIWDAENQPAVTLSGHSDRVESAIFSPTGSFILTTSSDSTAKIWSPTGTLIATLSEHDDIVWNAAISHDDLYIVTASRDKTARVWHSNGRLIAKLSGHSDEVISAEFDSTGRYIVTASPDKKAILWSIDGRKLATLEGHSDTVYTAVFSPDGKYILTASKDNTARIWDRKGNTVAILDGHTKEVWRAQFSSDGRYILTASNDDTALLWVVSNEKVEQLTALIGHTDTVWEAVFSPDMNYILTVSRDNTARLWNFQGDTVAILSGHTDVVWDGDFSSDSKFIVTASLDGTARIWDTQGNVVTIFSGHSDKVWAVNFSPEGSRVLTSSEDDTARVWLVRESDLLAAASCKVGRALTEEEIQTYNVPTPQKFRYEDRQCPPVYSWGHVK